MNLPGVLAVKLNYGSVECNIKRGSAKALTTEWIGLEGK